MRPRLVLLRHGVTLWNVEGRFQGHRDPQLSDDGRVEAELLGRRLAGNPDERPQLLVSSTLVRAAQTAEAVGAAIAEVAGPPEIRLDPRLMEIGQGEWEGRTHADLARDDAARYSAWRSDDHAQPPGAEPIEQVVQRVGSLLDEIGSMDEPVIGLVSHGGTLRVAIGLLLGLQASRFWRMDLDNCSISSFAPAEEGWSLTRWNDTAHLLGRAGLHVDESEGEPLAL